MTSYPPPPQPVYAPPPYYYNAYPMVPMAPMAPMAYSDMMAYRNTLIQQQQEYRAKRLKDNYPTKYALINGSLLIGLAIVQIVLQILMINNSVSFSNYFIGLWGGCFYIVCAILAMSVVGKRSYGLFTGSQVMHMFGFCVGMAQLSLSIMVITRSSSTFCDLSFTYTCTSNSGYAVPILICGIASAILCLVFFIVMSNFINGIGCYARQGQVSSFNNNNPNSTTYQPNDLRYTNDYTRPAAY